MTVMWTPPPDVRETTEIGRFAERYGFDSFEALQRWSVDDLEGFWQAVWDFYGLRAQVPHERVLGSREMPGAEWFPGARLNYAARMLDDDPAQVAVVARSNTRGPVELTAGELRDQVARARAGLVRLGVGRGDRVVAYLPNIPETLVAFLAAASLGAIWASVSPEFGARSVIDRLAQIEPKVLLVVNGYTYRDTRIDRQAEVAAIAAGLPTVEHVVEVGYGDDAAGWEALLSETAPLEFAPVPFDHPLYVLFSSGTTGLPKAIVHGHGGILLEHVKNLGLGWDLKPGGRLLWFTTTAWMMWNALVSALLLRSSIVMLDGDPAWPDLAQQWRLAEETRPTVMGVSPAFLMACRKEGLQPGRDFDLSSIRVVPIAGSPLPPEGYDYLYEQLGPDMLLVNGSGGTDVCTRDRLRQRADARRAGRDGGALAGGGRHGVRPRRPRGDRRARGAGDPAADAVDARRLLERPRRASATARRTSTCTPASGAKATGCGSPKPGPASSPAAPMRRSTVAACGSARASSTR